MSFLEKKTIKPLLNGKSIYLILKREESNYLNFRQQIVLFKKHAQLCTVYIKFSNIFENIGTIEIGQ